MSEYSIDQYDTIMAPVPGEIKYPLTAEQERRLFEQFRYLKWLAEQRPEYTAKMQEVRNQIVEATLPLVEIVACKTGKRLADYEEKVADGYMAVIKAVENYDPSRGARFKTFANRMLTWAFLGREANQQHISIPDGYDTADPRYGEEGVEIDETSEQLTAALQARLTDREQLVVAKRFGIGRKASGSVRELADELGIGINHVRKILNTAMQSLKI